MKQVNLYEAKTGLSALVEEAAAGEEIVIAKNGKPKAKLLSVDAVRNETLRQRRFGIWSHYGWKAPADFDAPDPEIEALFYGDGSV
jgi:prevent-host-death family protein